MPKVKKYVESHWLFYALQGVASLAFGGYLLFAVQDSVSELTAIVGVSLLCLGVIETFNLLYRKHYGDSLILSLILAVTEVGIALLMLFTRDYNMAWPLTLTAIYTIGRGILEIILAFKSMTDLTDRFMWIVCGITGAVIGVAILNSGNFMDSTAFIKFFSSYMMIYGVTNLFYGVHNRNRLQEQKEERAERRQLAAKKRAEVKQKRAAKKTAKRGGKSKK
ncbi:DUF308 domain-containing protein [Candidatus Saccharibacteria bacterium]|nr:DUF308 domain-containing protein [Candidatus Saccharibacteria bacterium]